ncbi:MAG TPA: phytanoyl-CoA dioxygenase family protein [Acidimicrobiales bacterium]|nr:phytanoyl-CoA dioxygenase family protein [Acidimicrobiales bacterium]
MTTVTTKAHPWNRDFQWTDHRARSGVLTQDQVDQFDRDGYVVVPRLLEPAELERTVAEVDAFEAESEDRLRALPDQRQAISEAGAITFTTHLVARSSWLRQVSAHPRILGICADLIGPDVRLYWDQAVYKKPEKPRRFPWHQDNGYTFVEPQEYVTVWTALTDATLVNGCPQVARGLHRLGTLRHRYVDPLGFECFPEFEDPAVAEVPAGGAVVFSSLTPHLTGPNTTEGVRKAYILQYTPAGAAVLRGDPRQDPAERIPCEEPTRQYEVLRGGKPAPLPALEAD